MPSWVTPLVSIGAALLVAIANYFVQRWRYSVDRLGVAVDQFCREVNSAADLAVEYWLIAPRGFEAIARCRRLEAELVGRQLRVQQLYLALTIAPAIDLDETGRRMPDLYDAMTGGSFGNSDRETDPSRGRKVQAVAAQINGHAWQALQRRANRLT